MSKKLVRGLLVVMMAGLLCGSAFAQQTIVLKYGHIWAASTRMNKAVLLAADIIKKRTKGAVEMKVYPGEQLGSQMDEMENVKQGSQDLTMVYGIDRYCPDFSLFNTPFVFRDAGHQYRVCMESKFAKDLIRKYMIENHGIRLLNMYYHGPRMLTTSADRPVKTPADVKGLKLRCPDITAWIDAWKGIGANVTAFPWGELYLALKQGIVDAQENPLGSIRDMKFYEVQKNVVLTEHIIDYPFVMINEKKWQSLKKYQKIILDAFEAGRQYTIKEGKKEEADSIAFFKSQGLNIVEINKSEWQKAFSNAPNKYKNGPEMYKKIQAIK
jgi:tripartite ATP-independent transporter DctP family solute receptor